MNFAPVYIINRLLFRLATFFHHWYYHGTRYIANQFIGVLGSLDVTFALKVTIRYFLQPLYKDYTIVGRILGVIFRTGRIAIAVVVYTAVSAVFLAAYVVWVAIPILIMLYAVRGLLL